VEIVGGGEAPSHIRKHHYVEHGCKKLEDIDIQEFVVAFRYLEVPVESFAEATHPRGIFVSQASIPTDCYV